jgi:hypothetical protein
MEPKLKDKFDAFILASSLKIQTKQAEAQTRREIGQFREASDCDKYIQGLTDALTDFNNFAYDVQESINKWT